MSENTRNVMIGAVVVLLALYGLGALVDLVLGDYIHRTVCK